MNDLAQKGGRVRLGAATLGDLPAGISRPNYDRSDLRPGIVHIGLGNFHRAHQAWYLHRLMQQGAAQDWAIIGAGVRSYDAGMRDHLIAQDCLSLLIELHPERMSAEVIGSMIDYLPVEEDNKSLIRIMSDPAIRIVSLTVTEGGYYIDPVSKGLDIGHPDIRHDVAHPETPRTAFGAMVAALKARRAADQRPFTAQSCDNLQGNGAILRQTIVSLAGLTDPDLARWIDTTAAFPNSMVDCIVPATGPREVARAAALGIDDPVPVTHEDFRQWVIEDDFCAGRPDWDLVGATFTDAVDDFEAMKIRILNAGHQVIANAGELLSIPTIAECMRHPVIAGFFRKVQTTEIAPYVAPVPDMTPQQYIRLIETRFANAAIMDTTRRVAFDGSARHTGFVVPIIRDALLAGGSLGGLALTEALWARMCAGTREDGSHIDANDPHWQDLQETALASRTDPEKWLAQRQYYGDLADVDVFANGFSDWLKMIWANGSEAAITLYTSLK